MDLHFGLTLSGQDFNTILNYGQDAEKRGFDSIWVADHYFMPHEALTALTALAMKTEKVKLGTCVVDANRRAPAMLAQITATLDKISRGRLILGISSGVYNEKTFGFPLRKKVSRFQEVVEVLKEFWTKDKIDYHGKFFDFNFESTKDRPFTRPVQKPHPPIWINGWGPRMKRIAGELCDGFITQHASPEIFKEEFKLVIAGAKKAGRDTSKIKAVHMSPMAIANTYDEALSCIREIGRNKLLMLTKPPHNYPERMGYEGPWEKPEDVPDEAIDQLLIFGTPDDCITKIEKYVDKGIKNFISQSIHPLGLESIKLYAEEVISYFKGY